MTGRAGILSDLRVGSSREIGPDDERLHAPDGDDRLWAETSWWVFTDPATTVAGWVYLLVRPTLGVASLGVWVWDDGNVVPWELPYSKSMVHIPVAADFDLRHVNLPEHGLELKVVEPFRAADLIYRDQGSIDIELLFRAAGPPSPMGVGATTGHLDQPLWVSGGVRVDGRHIAVDGPAFRDRTWSSRPETAPGALNSYTWAVGEHDAFQQLAVLRGDGTPAVTGGFLGRDGTTSPLTAVTREVLERDVDGRPRRLAVRGRDELDRELHADGVVVSAAAINGFAGYLTWASLVRWDVGGREVWGEDHDSWPHPLWRSRVRERSRRR
jgi:hypothetical protein